MEGVLGFVLSIGSLFLMFFVFQWIMAKMFGVHFHGKFQAREAFQEQHELENTFHKYTNSNPEMVKAAINKCRKKGFAKTHYNILVEIKKIENKNNGHQSLSKKITEKIGVINEKFKIDNSKSNIEQLERLNKLRIEGGLTDEEYQDFKKQILIKTDKIVKTRDKNETPKFSLSESEKQEAITTINLLYFEFKDKTELLKNKKLAEIHQIILKKNNAVSLINNYENLFKLYTNDLITIEEFNSKKEQLFYTSIKTHNHGTV